MNKQSGIGIASMVIGIISLVFSCFGVGFLGALGFIFAIAAFMQRDRGKRTAIAGLTTSVMAFLISFFVVAVGMSMFSYDGENNKKSIVDENKKESADVIITHFTFDELELYNKKGIVIKATGNKSDEEPKIVKERIEGGSQSQAHRLIQWHGYADENSLRFPMCAEYRCSLYRLQDTFGWKQAHSVYRRLHDKGHCRKKPDCCI